MPKSITNYDLYRDASLDRLHPKYKSSTGIAKELYRWFGPSPMRAPLHLRISNRNICYDQHVRLLGTEPGDKYQTKNWKGELKTLCRLIERRLRLNGK